MTAKERCIDMEEKKLFGRVNLNKLDFILAISAVLACVGAIWLSIGICITNAGDQAFAGFVDLFKVIGLVVGGPDGVLIALLSIFFYISLLVLFVGSVILAKKGEKGRIPGLVSVFFSTIAIITLILFCHELINGSAKGSVNMFWPVSTILIIVLLVATLIVSLVMSFNFDIDVNIEEIETSQAFEELEETPLQEDVAKEEPLPVPAYEEPLQEEIVEEEAEENIEDTPDTVIEESLVEPVEDKEETVEEIPEEVHEDEPSEEAVVKEEIPEEEQDEDDEAKDNLEEEQDVEGEEVPQIEEKFNPNDFFATLNGRKKRVPFETKIKRSPQDVKDRYNELMNILRMYDFNDRISVPGETFSFKRERLIFVNLIGKTFRVYFRLDPKQYSDSKIPLIDCTVIKKFADVPLCIKIKSDLSVKRVQSLTEDIAKENNVPKK